MCSSGKKKKKKKEERKKEKKEKRKEKKKQYLYYPSLKAKEVLCNMCCDFLHYAVMSTKLSLLRDFWSSDWSVSVSEESFPVGCGYKENPIE